MAVQITGRQIANAAVGVAKLDLSTGTFDFQNAVLQVATPSEGDASNRVASKGYVDGVAQGLDIKDSCKHKRLTAFLSVLMTAFSSRTRAHNLKTAFMSLVQADGLALLTLPQVPQKPEHLHL